jgi:hypothetical protein
MLSDMLNDMLVFICETSKIKILHLQTGESSSDR